MRKTKVFRSGNSIAVRIPKDFGLKEGEVYIVKEGERLVIIPKEKRWEALFELLNSVPETKDFLTERRQPEPQERELF